MKLLALVFAAALLLSEPYHSTAAPLPQKSDKCAVCGMFVSKYKEWVASITTLSGKVYYFDGAKDMFTFYHSSTSFVKSIDKSHFGQIEVTDYYSLKWVDAKKAWFVIGSDVNGPMGKELVPFAKKKDAESFIKDHHGKKILKFSQINQEVLKQLN